MIHKQQLVQQSVPMDNSCLKLILILYFNIKMCLKFRNQSFTIVIPIPFEYFLNIHLFYKTINKSS